MTFSPASLRRGRLLPGIGMALAFLFLTGQFFACCRVNADLAAALKNAWHHLAGHSHSHAHEEVAEESSGHRCHGHGNAHVTSADAGARDADHCNLAETESCLSEHAFAGKPMLASDLALEIPVLAQVPEFHAPRLAEPQIVERPRPQNKSSPPLFLITLRILV